MFNVSVIMPVYNNEETLERAIESILNQSLYSFELILVNDGSTDRSGEICDMYVEKEPLLIEVIHQKHQGLANARNKGLFNSSGDYVYFADAKDIFDQKMLRSNVKLAQEKNAEIVVFGFSCSADDDMNAVEHHLPRMPHLSSQEDFRVHYRNFHHFHPYALFNKLYDRKYLLNNRLKFYNLPIREDAFFNLGVYRELNSVAFNRRSYCQRHSIKSDGPTAYQEKIVDIQLELANYLEAMITYWDYKDEYADLIAQEYLKVVYLVMENLTAFDSPFTVKQQEQYLSEILGNTLVREHLPNAKLPNEKHPLKLALLSQLQKGNGKKALELYKRIKRTEQSSKKLSNVLRKWFDKD